MHHALRLAFAAAAIAIPMAIGAAVQSSPAPSSDKGDAQALRMALDDEYRAEATYAAVIDAFGEARPFINIINAERHHAEMAKAEMDRLGIAYDAINPYLGTIVAPASLLAACEQGIAAEKENIALYDRILPTVEDAQVRDVLARLQWASRERHLPAFTRCVERGGSMAAGPGRGKGQGHGQGHGSGRSPGYGPGQGGGNR